MIKNNKYYCPPPKNGGNLKELFKNLAAAGVGRPVDQDGFPSGSWTPELLAEAISAIEANHDGIELRTVQLWFQDNDKGISADNIRWLARVLGCDDHAATSEWQIALSKAQSRLSANRRARKKAEIGDVTTLRKSDPEISADKENSMSAEIIMDDTTPLMGRGFCLVRRSEAFFSRGSPLDLPASVFAGAVALGFSAYFLGIHSITYAKADGTIKQVGFLWAPNWTFLFMAFMPLFFAFAVELVIFWKKEARLDLLEQVATKGEKDSWIHRVEASSYTFWAVFLICIGFAGLFQWIDVRLMPLVNGGGDYAIDWGSLATVRPDTISVPSAIAFTGFAYLYMCCCFYLFFVGLILLHTAAHDFWEIQQAPQRPDALGISQRSNDIALQVMRGVFRCTILGFLIAICMKLQSFYLTSDGETVVDWLLGDASSVLSAGEGARYWIDYSMPTHYSSLLIALATCVVFFYSAVRVGMHGQFQAVLVKMLGSVILLAIGYLLIGTFSGFSVLLGSGVILGVYGVFDPEFRAWWSNDLGSNESVS